MRQLKLILLFLLVGVSGWSSFAADPAAESEFKPIFNGKDLTGWRGDSAVWTVKGGVLTGHVPPGKPGLQRLVWSEDPALGDFELRFSFRLARGNAGVLYRVGDLGEGDYRAYEYSQLDKTFRNGETANIHESFNGTTPQRWGRNRLANIGEEVVILKGPSNDNKPDIKRIDVTQATPNEIRAKSLGDPNQWQEGAIIARGYHLTHLLNGFVVAEAWDLHSAFRRDKGQLMLRVVGPMNDTQVEFRNVRLRKIPN